MDILSNKEIYVLLKILNDKKAKKGIATNIELDKHFELKELEHIQQQVSLSANKAFNSIITIEETYKRIVGIEVPNGYKLNIIDISSIEGYSNNYVNNLIQNNIAGLTIDVIDDFCSNISENSDLEHYTLSEIKYMPVLLFAYVNKLIELTSITHDKYKLTSSNMSYGDCLMDMNPVSIQTFSFKIGIDKSKSNEALISRLQELQNLFNEISGDEAVIKSEAKSTTTKVKHETMKEDNTKPKPKKRRKHFSPKIQELFDYVEAQAQSRDFQIYTFELVGDGKLYPSKDTLSTAVNELNNQYREIINDETFNLMKFDRLLDCYCIKNIWKDFRNL